LKYKDKPELALENYNNLLSKFIEKIENLSLKEWLLRSSYEKYENLIS